MPLGPYGILTARDSITDHYAVASEQKGLTPTQFVSCLDRIASDLKVNNNNKLLNNE